MTACTSWDAGSGSGEAAMYKMALQNAEENFHGGIDRDGGAVPWPRTLPGGSRRQRDVLVKRPHPVPAQDTHYLTK